MITDGEGSQVDPATVARLRAICGQLPEVIEEDAWVGTRWRIRTHTFAHVLRVDPAYPPVYAKALGGLAPATVLMFRSSGPELEVLRNSGAPFFAPPWREDEIGLVLDDRVDWSEIVELITESYCTMAPKKLGRQVERPESA